MSSSDVTFLHKMRLSANKLIARFGFEIVRRPIWSESENICLRIGDFDIHVHANNSLWQEYKRNPEYTAQLGRLAECIFDGASRGYVIDVGANVGDTAALLRSKVSAPIVCVEGDRQIFEGLKRNTAQMRDVSLHQCFLGEKTEQIHVHVAKDGWDATLIPVNRSNGNETKSVEILSLDDFVARLSMDGPCRLLKLDIEGFDLRAIRGASKFLAKDRPAVIFEYNHQNLTALGEEGLQIFPFLEALGYDQLCLFDGQGAFMLSCGIRDAALLDDLDGYARVVEGLFYYDICAFHSADAETAAKFIAQERSHRSKLVRR